MKARAGFSIHFDNDRFSRSYYPGAVVPVQEQLIFDNVRVLHEYKKPFLTVNTPIDAVTITNSSFRDSPIIFHGNRAMSDYLVTRMNLIGCNLNHPEHMDLVENRVENKRICIKMTASLVMQDKYCARFFQGPGIIEVDSDVHAEVL